ncbi:MAG TPA: type II toxin-antitoxin system RelE/ParE family toxin [Desulfobulbaceae bacterium]|nr:type II toxin-antitoxin system RelE/ParE family toxin [Desulfobulbaceae bacterium]
MTRRVKFSETATQQLKKLGKQTQRNILKYLKKRIETDDDPQRYGDPLRRSLSGLWKYRVGDHRLICEIQQEEIVVLILPVGHRRNVYGGH